MAVCEENKAYTIYIKQSRLTPSSFINMEILSRSDRCKHRVIHMDQDGTPHTGSMFSKGRSTLQLGTLSPGQVDRPMLALLQLVH